MTDERQFGRLRRCGGRMVVAVLAAATVVPMSVALTSSAASASPLPAPCQRPGPVGDTLQQTESAVDPVAASVGDDPTGFWSGVNGVFAIPNGVACLVGVGL
jgi:hypothetical protein